MKSVVVFFCDQDTASRNMLEQAGQVLTLHEAGPVLDQLPAFRAEVNGCQLLLCRTADFVYRRGADYASQVADRVPDAELAIIAGFHSGSSGRILTLHTMGNPSATDKRLAGAYTLAYAAPLVMKSLLLNLERYRIEEGLDDFTVTQEVTHGSPVELPIPIIDYEIGSDEDAYRHPVAGRVLARALCHVADSIDACPAIGFGGLHYAEKFAKANLSGPYAVGHIFSTMVAGETTVDLFRQAVDRSVPNARAIILDKKEKGEHKKVARQAAEELGLEVVNHNAAVVA